MLPEILASLGTKMNSHQGFSVTRKPMLIMYDINISDLFLP
jgi:hypothetical protein